MMINKIFLKLRIKFYFNWKVNTVLFQKISNLFFNRFFNCSLNEPEINKKIL